MRIQGETQLLNVLVADARRRRLGRIVGVYCAPQDAYFPTWFVLRMRGWRNRLRAVPARDAQWGMTGGVQVLVPGAAVLASPVPSGSALDAHSRAALAHFYAQATVVT